MAGAGEHTCRTAFVQVPYECGPRWGGAPPEQVAEALAAALRSVVHVLDPEAILLGGSFTELGGDLIADVAERLHARTLGARWAPCDVRPAALGADAALIGAATVALDAVIADPTIVPARTSTRSA